MADQEDKESKTEEATEKKIKDSLEKGQTPVSKEVSILFSLLAVLFLFIYAVPSQSLHVTDELGRLLDHSADLSLESTHDLTQVLRTATFIGVGFALPFFIALIIAGIASSVFQNPPAIVWNRVAPQLSRISLKKGFERIYSTKGFVEFLKSVAKIVFSGVVAYFAVYSIDTDLLSGMYSDSQAFLTVVQSNTVKIIGAICVSMILVTGFDVFWTRVEWLKDLRMSHKEIKDELKQALGDPIIKSRQRSIAFDRARNRMMQAVPTATVVIANPTHYSVALRYKPDEDEAPIVVALGRDLIALKIREIAASHTIPVIEDVQLARAMYKAVKVEQPIPPEFFAAVAQILATIRRRTPQSSFQL